jgi:hypothetical protein
MPLVIRAEKVTVRVTALQVVKKRDCSIPASHSTSRKLQANASNSNRILAEGMGMATVKTLLRVQQSLLHHSVTLGHVGMATVKTIL